MKKKHVLDTRYFNRSGDLNASSRKDALDQILAMAQEVANGTLELSNTHPEDVKMETAQMYQDFCEAYADKKSPAWAEVGAALSSELYQRMSRAGFMRTLLARGEVMQGSIPRIAVKTPNAYAVVGTGPVRAKTQFVRDRYLFPDEFNIMGDVRVDLITMNQGTSDVLDRLYFDANEAIMVQEDRTVKSGFDIAAGVYNDTQYFTGAIGHSVVSSLQYSVEQWGNGVSTLLMALDFLKDMRSTMNLNDSFDPASRLELFTTGRLGVWLGAQIMTDGLREPNLRVLDMGEIYALASPEMLGGYTDRGPVKADPRDNDGNVPSRGWFMHEQVSIAVGNAKAVAKAKRL